MTWSFSLANLQLTEVEKQWTRLGLMHLAIAIVIAIVATLIGGEKAGISAILAGGSCVVPNAIMFLGFYVNDRFLKKPMFPVVVALEVMKIAISVVLLILSFWLYKEMNGLVFILSFVISIKSYLLLLLRVK